MKKSTRGFTLIEFLVGSFILVLIGVAMLTFQRYVFSTNTLLTRSLSLQGEARRSLVRMSAEIRTASPSSTGGYALEQTGTSTFIFYSNVDSDQYMERVRYFLSGTTLRRGIVKPSGSPLTYNTANETFTNLAHGIYNASSTPVFQYYDSNYYGTTTALSQPITVSVVRLVQLTLHIDTDPDQPPEPLELTTQISMRNLKDNL